MTGFQNYWDILIKRLVMVLAIILAGFLMYTALFGEYTVYIQRGLPLLITSLLIFYKYPFSKKHRIKSLEVVMNTLFVTGALVSSLYLMFNYAEISRRIGIETQLDVIVGVIGILVVLEAARRTTGLAIPIIASSFALYGYFGKYVPGFFSHRGFTLTDITRYVFYGQDGILGTALGVMTSYVYVLFIFGSLLQVTGAGQFFLNLAISLTGRLRSGPAQGGVVGSSLFGSISGSAVANVVGTGTFTIPLMIKSGYTPQFAAAVEAVASSGGQLMPPVMGAAAFLMAEILSVPYLTVVKAALIPALLYYITLFAAVHFEASRLGLQPIPKAERPKLKKLLKRDGLFLIPLLVLITILVMGYSPARAAMSAIFLIFVVAFIIRKPTRFKFDLVLKSVENSAMSSLSCWGAMSAIGVIIAVVSMTGFGTKFAEVVMQVAGSSLLFALVLTMLASLVLGMGLPTVACYILLGIICAPGLVKLGVPLIAAHLFIFYYGIISAITPPVALASYVASGIADCSPVKASYQAIKLGITAFIIPYFFIYSPELVFIGSGLGIFRAFVTAAIGVIALAVGIIGFLFTKVSNWERGLYYVAAILMINAGVVTELAGLIIISLLVLKNWLAGKRNTQTELAS